MQGPDAIENVAYVPPDKVARSQQSEKGKHQKFARTLEEGLRNLGDSPEVEEVFGALFLKAYAAVKLDEFEEFNRVISSWEREHLLLQV